MKRYCKNVDIYDRTFIKTSIEDCLRDKYKRNDVVRMFSEYSGLPKDFLFGIAKTGNYKMFEGIVLTITESIRTEIICKNYVWKPIWYTYKLEGNKMRRIGIQDIKQQLYDYIAVHGLKELFDKRIGYYQCAALPGKGQVFGMKAIKKKLKSHKIRYGWKGDGEKFYENINRDILKSLLKKYVKNEPLLHLVFCLIDEFEKGLSIGSYLSQYLSNFYMSFLYRYIAENLWKERKKKTGKSVKVKMLDFVLIYMDDIHISGPNKKLLKIAVKCIKKFAKEKLDITIKPQDNWIDFEKYGYIDMMGFLISKNKVIVRPAIFRRFRKSIHKVRKNGKINKDDAQRIISRYGWMKNANCKHFIKRNKVNYIIEKCKEMIGNGENVVYVATGKSKNCIAS